MPVWADTAHNNNRGVHLAFSTWNSKVVDSNVTSFIALNSNFGGKWNTLYLALLSFMTHIQINVVSTEVTMADMVPVTATDERALVSY